MPVGRDSPSIGTLARKLPRLPSDYWASEIEMSVGTTKVKESSFWGAGSYFSKRIAAAR